MYLDKTKNIKFKEFDLYIKEEMKKTNISKSDIKIFLKTNFVISILGKRKCENFEKQIKRKLNAK